MIKCTNNIKSNIVYWLILLFCYLFLHIQILEKTLYNNNRRKQKTNYFYYCLINIFYEVTHDLGITVILI